VPKKPPVLTKPKTPSKGEVLAQLKALPCFEEVKAKILDGVPVLQVARWIQDQGEYATASEASLARALHRFKEELPPAAFVQAALPKVHQEALAEVKQGLAEVDELAHLYALQKGRIHKLLKVEETMPSILFPNLSQEFRIAAELLRTSAELKGKLGLLKPGPREPSGDQGAGEEVPIEDTIEALAAAHPTVPVAAVFRDPEKVHRIIGLMKTVSTLQVMVESAPAKLGTGGGP